MVSPQCYNTFCLHSPPQVELLHEDTLQRYVVSLAGRASYGTIKMYLCDLQYFSKFFGFPQSISSMAYLYYLLRGIPRTQGPLFTRHRCNPIITHQLQLIHHRIRLVQYHHFQKTTLCTTTSLVFFDLFHCSEYTYKSRFLVDPSKELMVYNVTIATTLRVQVFAWRIFSERIFAELIFPIVLPFLEKIGYAKKIRSSAKTNSAKF